MIRASFTIPGLHSWQRPRAHVVNGRVVMFTDKRTREFVERVARLAREAIPHKLVTHYGVSVRVYTHNKRPRDCDRVLNGVLDGLVKSGMVPDDRLCWRQSVSRRLTDGQERIEVEVFEMEPVREGALL